MEQKMTRRKPQFYPRTLTATDAAKYIGFGRNKFYELLNAREIPAPVRIGQCWRWRLLDLKRWLNERNQQYPDFARNFEQGRI